MFYVIAAIVPLSLLHPTVRKGCVSCVRVIGALVLRGGYAVARMQWPYLVGRDAEAARYARWLRDHAPAEDGPGTGGQC